MLQPASRHRPFLGLLLVSTAFLGACSSQKEKPQPPPPAVTVTPVTQTNVPIYREWVGTMAGNIDADIRPKVEGFLLKRLYTEGSLVKKGQPLFQLDSRQAKADVDEAQGHLAQSQAALSQSRIDVKRYTPLVAQKAVSQAELDKARSLERASGASVDASQAALDNAKLDLRWTTVVSPISGIAGIAKVAIGDLITPNTAMATVSAVDPIYVDINVAEQDYLRFARENKEKRGKAGQNLQLILGDASVFPHRGRVLLVNRQVDTRTGTIAVRAEFPNPGNLLRPGQYAKIRAVTENLENALVIPQRAVAELQGIYQVGVVGSDNKVAIRQVKLGAQFGDKWVITSGLQAGDNVVVDGLQRLRDGMTVAPQPFKDTQQAASVTGEQ